MTRYYIEHKHLLMDRIKEICAANNIDIAVTIVGKKLPVAFHIRTIEEFEELLFDEYFTDTISIAQKFNSLGTKDSHEVFSIRIALPENIEEYKHIEYAI